MQASPRLVESQPKPKPKLTTEQQDEMFADIDRLIGKHGNLFLSAMRRYLVNRQETLKREKKIARLQAEVEALKRK